MAATTVLSILVLLCCAYTSIATSLPRCGPPDSPAYGSFSPQKKYYYIGSVVRFSCKDGFLLKGNSYTKCVYNRYKRRAEWLHDSPVCKSNQCPDLDDPRYGDVSLTGRNPGDKATYTCDKGFVLIGSSVAKCLRNGKWSRKPPQCRPIRCPRLRDPRYGDVDDGNNRVGTKAVYTCDDGFKLNGQSTRVCQYNGKWSGKAPTCDPATCPKLDDPAYGSVDDGDNSVGTVAVYTCDEGFKLNGGKIRTCEKNCEWSGEAPTCEPATCPKLDDPDYGSVDDGDNSLGTVAVYTCDEGFKLNGGKTRTCEKNCEWSGEAPTCERVDCGKPPKPRYGYVKFWKTTPGYKAYHGCSRGYHLVGSRVRYCRHDGHWSGKTPSCQRIYYEKSH